MSSPANASAALAAPPLSFAQRIFQGFRAAAPGLILTLALGLGALLLARQPAVQGWGLSALTLAIVAGIFIGNTVFAPVERLAAPGVGVAKQTLLRAGIVLYGLRLTFQDIAAVGTAGLVVDALVVAITFVLALQLGTRWLGLSRRQAALIGAGSAICGAAAVLATAPVVASAHAARDEGHHESPLADQVAVAVATVVVFGTLAMFTYPALYAALAHWGWAVSPEAFGLYTGATVHEVAQVVAAGRAISPDAAATAVIAKMLRVMMLAPFLVILAGLFASGGAGNGGNGANGGNVAGRGAAVLRAFPWFALGFVALAGFNSLDLLPQAVKGGLIVADDLLLATAMGALGLTTRFSAIRRAGPRPLLLAGLLALWLVAGGGALTALTALALHLAG
ncbi:YeiH family putative sulfate export transporter [Oryzomicrobium sp.]|uniref:YeiH family protein n=1 Tax=Oryzomicrobium sp. TaxID=1911578 RepID=UPI0025E81864|nr:YeiH family putative sulfate export transporter [Oryzomicrobium sp.]MCE1243955.1 YeiH family protein [Oryzomicrobium sp.]